MAYTTQSPGFRVTPANAPIKKYRYDGGCGKKPFLTRRDAAKELLKILEHNAATRRERAFYECPVCYKWHLTSQKQYDSPRKAVEYR